MIDPRAAISAECELGENVRIGAFTIIEAGVRIGDNTEIGPHVVIRSGTRIGSNNRIFQFVSLGEEPQHLGYRGEPTELIIGNHNTIREYCSISRGTPQDTPGVSNGIGGKGVTVIGNHNFLMAYVHIAHDCRLGDHCIFANGASLAGHVQIGDHAVMGGFALVHQFCRIGAHAITGIGAVCLQDVPPYLLVAGNTATPHGLNKRGLRARDFPEDAIMQLKWAYQVLYQSGLLLQDAIAQLQAAEDPHGDIRCLVDFLQASTERGIVRPKKHHESKCI